MNKFYPVVFFLFLFGCKSTKEVLPLPSLQLTVLYGASNSNANGAWVYLYTNYNSYVSGITSAASDSAKVINGTVTFNNIPTPTCWVLVYYTNGNIAYNNLNAENTFKNTLNEGSYTDGVINLQQSSYYLYFTPPKSNGTVSYPLTVKVSSGSYSASYQIKDSLSKSPYISLNPATYNYQVSVNFLWDATFTINNQSADTTQITLGPANGLISFWVDDTNSAYLPIQVELSSIHGSNDTVGTIFAIRTSAPTYTDTSGAANIYRDFNTYAYKATSDKNKGCYWMDTIVLNAAHPFIPIKLINKAQICQ